MRAPTGAPRPSAPIVYGDPAYEAALGELMDRLRARIAALQTAGAVTLDDLRALLIRACELEQAAEDGLPGGRKTGKGAAIGVSPKR